MAIKPLLCACAATLGLGASHAQANTIIGVFSDVGTSGYVTHDPNIFSSTYFDNSATAVYSITNSTDPTLAEGLQATGSKLQWGADDSVDPSDQFSELIFFGGEVPSNPGQPFTIGEFTYLNGTSDLNSLIFSADLSFYDNSISSNTYLGTAEIIITTTSNLGASLAQDADYINIVGGISLVSGLSIEAYEDSEGGTGVTAVLTGYFVDDPHLEISDVSLAPGQPDTSGLIGDEPAAGVAPEPSTWAMMLLGFGGLGLAGWRVGRKAAAPAARSA